MLLFKPALGLCPLYSVLIIDPELLHSFPEPSPDPPDFNDFLIPCVDICSHIQLSQVPGDFATGCLLPKCTNFLIPKIYHSLSKCHWKFKK